MSTEQKQNYEDRQSGKKYADAKEMINDYITRFKSAVFEAINEEIDFPLLDKDGYSKVTRGSATVGINVIEDKGILLLLCEIMPVNTSRETELYRKLLELNYIATSDGAFAVESGQNMVCLRSLRRLSGLDYEEFEDLLNAVATVSDEWDDMLKQLFG